MLWRRGTSWRDPPAVLSQWKQHQPIVIITVWAACICTFVYMQWPQRTWFCKLLEKSQFIARKPGFPFTWFRCDFGQVISQARNCFSIAATFAGNIWDFPESMTSHQGLFYYFTAHSDTVLVVYIEFTIITLSMSQKRKCPMPNKLTNEQQETNWSCGRKWAIVWCYHVTNVTMLPWKTTWIPHPESR